MLRDIGWIEKREDGTRREIRARVLRDRVDWQFRTSDDVRWDRIGPPLPADWDELVTRVENRYQRRAVKHADVVLVRRLRDAVHRPA